MRRKDVFVTRARKNSLVETEWLSAHLGDPSIRIFDCSVAFRNSENGPMASNGKPSYDRGHIPGSAFMDLVEDLSAQNTNLPFMMPSAEQASSVLGRLGVNNDSTVVLYDHAEDLWANMWATRAWWILRVYGFQQAHVLNGGLYKWRREGRQISEVPATYPATQFVVKFQEGLVVDKQTVLAAIGKRNTCIINALTPDDFSGTSNFYGRPGHIPRSVNVPTVDLIDPVTHAYLSADDLHALLSRTGALERDNVITYCGAGIAASSDAFVLFTLGVEDVAIYDGSLAEWAADQSLPLQTGLP